MSFRTRLNALLHPIGFEISKVKIGVLPHRDLARWIDRDSRPLILDVGANVGQSIAGFKRAFPHARIHSVPPSTANDGELSTPLCRFDNRCVNTPAGRIASYTLGTTSTIGS